MDILMPQLGETVREGTVSTWYKKPGDRIAADESLFEVETEKVSTEIPCPVAGVLREILVEAGISVAVGTRLAIVDEGVAAAPRPATAPSAGAGAERLSPAVRRILQESGLDARDVAGSGRDGRITREDVVAHLARTAAAPVARAAPAAIAATAAPPAAPRPAAAGDDRIVALNKVRRATAAHMVRSVATSPHTLQAVEVDFLRIESLRQTIGARWKEREGFALNYLPFVCTALCTAIAEFPLVNASFGDDALVVHGRIHLGIAVDLDFEGLVAPVLRDADRKNPPTMAREIAALVARARAGSLVPDELQGGTYTISNSGSFGTLFTAPIINQPQVAILSTDGVRKRPVVVEGPDGDSIAIRPVGILAQSFDHRAFDGAYSAAFLRRLKRELETRDWRSAFPA